MGETIVKENTPPIASNQPVTPAPVVTPQSEDPAVELARLRQERIDAEKRIADKDKLISDLSTEKATLETRLSGFQAVESVIPTVQPEVQTEPNAPKGQPVGAYVRPEDIPEIIERTGFINRMKEDNKDMMEFGLEPVITFKAEQLMKQGKSFKEAVATAVKEQREKFDKIKQPTAPETKQTVPSGLQGEGGAPASPEPKPVKVDEMDDEGVARVRLRQKRGL